MGGQIFFPIQSPVSVFCQITDSVFQSLIFKKKFPSIFLSSGRERLMLSEDIRSSFVVHSLKNI